MRLCVRGNVKPLLDILGISDSAVGVSVVYPDPLGRTEHRYGQIAIELANEETYFKRVVLSLDAERDLLYWLLDKSQP